MSIPSNSLLVIAAPLFLISCAHGPLATLSAAISPKPAPPSGAFGKMAIPPRGPDGAYITPNRALGPKEAAWHVRAALNVAALSCKGANGEAITAAYNRMLKDHRLAFAKAHAATQDRYRKLYSERWQAAFDEDMTKLYNFFAQPAVQSAFCKAAAPVADQLAAYGPGGFTTFASTTLPRLDAPFTAFYEAYDRYRAKLAAWDANHGTQVDPRGQIASADE